MTRIEPLPGRPDTEPVATAEQSHVVGRVGPATIAEDAHAVAHVPESVEQVEPGTVRPADAARVSGPLHKLADDERDPDGDPDGDGEPAGQHAARPTPAKRAS